MNEEIARNILGEYIKEDKTLYSLGAYLAWPSCSDKELACLDGQFSADELEATAWWMRNKSQ